MPTRQDKLNPSTSTSTILSLLKAMFSTILNTPSLSSKVIFTRIGWPSESPKPTKTGGDFFKSLSSFCRFPLVVTIVSPCKKRISTWMMNLQNKSISFYKKGTNRTSAISQSACSPSRAVGEGGRLVSQRKLVFKPVKVHFNAKDVSKILFLMPRRRKKSSMSFNFTQDMFLFGVTEG